MNHSFFVRAVVLGTLIAAASGCSTPGKGSRRPASRDYAVYHCPIGEDTLVIDTSFQNLYIRKTDDENGRLVFPMRPKSMQDVTEAYYVPDRASTEIQVHVYKYGAKQALYQSDASFVFSDFLTNLPKSVTVKITGNLLYAQFDGTETYSCVRVKTGSVDEPKGE